MKFKLSDSFELDTTDTPYVDEGFRMCLTATSGAGKSYTGALIIEQWLDQGGVVVIFQPIAEWHTLKAEYPIQVVGGPHAQDIPLIESEPELYAHAVIEEGISMIFYTRDIEDQEDLVKFVYKFTNKVMDLQQTHKRPLLFVLEEAHHYAPISAKGQLAPPWVYNRMIKILEDVHTQGRKLNICPMSMTQRAQQLNYAIRQLCNFTMFGRFSPQDAKYIDKNILTFYRKMGIEITGDQLVQLTRGQFFAIAGENSRIIDINEERKTPHGADTPELEYIIPVSDEIHNAISDLGEKLKEMLAKRKEEEDELNKAKRKIKKLENKVDDLTEKNKLKMNLQELLKSANGTVDTSKMEELEEKIESHITEKSDLEDQIAELKLQVKGEAVLQKEIDKLNTDLESFNLLKDALEKIFRPKIIEKTITRQVTSHVPSSKNTALKTSGKFPWLDIWLPKLKTPQKKVLTVFTDGYPQNFSEREVAVLAGYKPKTGSFKQALRDLNKWGLLVKNGERYKLNDKPPGT